MTIPIETTCPGCGVVAGKTHRINCGLADAVRKAVDAGYAGAIKAAVEAERVACIQVIATLELVHPVESSSGCPSMREQFIAAIKARTT